MFLKKTIRKTKTMFLKSLKNLKNFLFGYENIPKTLFLNPLSCASINQRTHHLDLIYPEFSASNESYPSDHDQHNAENCAGVINISCDKTDEMKHKVDITPSQVQPTNNSATSSYRYENDSKRTFMLAQQMKELEMMDVGDVDQTLDVEEALHYYSRLTCPEYVDMVNKFFIDMYTDFNVPQPEISKSSSLRRLGPLTQQAATVTISSSSKRVEPGITRQPSNRISSSSRRLDSGVTPQASISVNSTSRRLDSGVTPQASIRVNSASRRLDSGVTPQASIRVNSASRRLDSGVTPQALIRVNSLSRRSLDSGVTPQGSIRINSSSRRLDSNVTPQGSIRINSSSRRLGPLTLCFD